MAFHTFTPLPPPNKPLALLGCTWRFFSDIPLQDLLQDPCHLSKPVFRELTRGLEKRCVGLRSQGQDVATLMAEPPLPQLQGLSHKWPQELPELYEISS